MKMPRTLITCLLAVMLAACGDNHRTTSVRVAGDSLNDSGAFGGLKFTVQGTAASPSKIWTEWVAASVGVNTLCARYAGTSAANLALNPAASTCTSYGVGGGRINVTGTSGDSTPLSVIQQLKDMAADAPFLDNQLVLIDGGGNDVADLFGAYLKLSSDGGASYVALLSELLTPAEVGAASAGGPAGLANAGGLYMKSLASRLSAAINTNVLSQGAMRVVVANTPDITLTPRFLAVLQYVTATSGAATAAQLKGMAGAWVQAFNAQLSADFKDSARVAVADFYSSLNAWVSQPASVGFTNVTTPACPVTGTDSDGFPSYNLATCTAASLSANPPAGGTASWWESYLFSDNFHPTPKGNQLFANEITKLLNTRGWLW